MNIPNNIVGNCKSHEKIYFTNYIFASMIFFVFLSNQSYLGISKYVYFPLMIIIVGSISLYRQNVIVLRTENFYILILIGMTILNLLRYNTNFDFGYFISYLIYFFIFLIITLQNNSKKSLDFLINSYILSSIVISAFIIFLHKDFNGWVGQNRKTLQFFNGDYADPNFISSFIVFGALFCLFKLISSNYYKIFKFLLIVIYAFISVGILLTSSRGALIGLIIGSLFIIFQGGFKKIVLSVFLLIALIPILIYFLPEGNTSRLFLDSYNDQSNIGRIENWKHSLQGVIDNPIFGAGLIDSTSYMKSTYNYSGAAHNTFINFTLNYGFLGLIIIITLIFIILRRAYVYRNYAVFGIILSLVFMGIMIELNLAIHFWIILILSYLILYTSPSSRIEGD